MRGETFVTRKITRGLARIKLGLQTELFLGNLDAQRDWGHARDYIEMHVAHAAAGEAARLRHRHRRAIHRARVRPALRQAARTRPHLAGLGPRREGPRPAGKVVVAVDPRYFRPTEVETLVGDASKARRELGWTPRTSFDELVREMVEADLKAAQRDALALRHGFDAYNVHETNPCQSTNSSDCAHMLHAS